MHKLERLGRGTFGVVITGPYNVEIRVANVIDRNSSVPAHGTLRPKPWTYECRFCTVTYEGRMGKDFTTAEDAALAAMKQLSQFNQVLSTIDFGGKDAGPRSDNDRRQPGQRVSGVYPASGGAGNVQGTGPEDAGTSSGDPGRHSGQAIDTEADAHKATGLGELQTSGSDPAKADEASTGSSNGLGDATRAGDLPKSVQPSGLPAAAETGSKLKGTKNAKR